MSGLHLEGGSSVPDLVGDVSWFSMVSIAKSGCRLNGPLMLASNGTAGNLD
jgi:hypothetical protein